MLTTGNQLKAARMLAEMEQLPLADAAGVSIGTVRNMEAQGQSSLKSSLATIRAVMTALEAAGVEFIPENGGGPGVRLRKGKGPDHPKPVGPATDAFDEMDAAIEKHRSGRKKTP